MEKIILLLKESPYIIIIVALGYFGKVHFENKINTVTAQVSEISKSSLRIKQDLRGIERQALIEFRVALEQWQHFLFSSLSNFSTRKITTQSINVYYDEENKLQLAVKVAVAKLGIVVQNEDVYLQAHPAIINISNTFHPFISKYLPVLIDLQAELEPIEARMKLFEQSMQNGDEIQYTVKQAEADKALNHVIQARLTETIQQYSDELLVIYPELSEQLTDLKIAMNEQVYRPMTSDKINEN